MLNFFLLLKELLIKLPGLGIGFSPNLTALALSNCFEVEKFYYSFGLASALLLELKLFIDLM